MRGRMVIKKGLVVGIVVALFALVFLIIPLGVNAECPCEEDNESESNGLNSVLDSFIEFDNIDVYKAKQIIDSNGDVVILDIRTQSEYEIGHLENSVLIPFEKLEESFFTLNLDIDDSIIIYDKDGTCSKDASEFFIRWGFSNIHNMVGGFEAWIDAGFDIIESDNNIENSIASNNNNLEQEFSTSSNENLDDNEESGNMEFYIILLIILIALVIGLRINISLKSNRDNRNRKENFMRRSKRRKKKKGRRRFLSVFLCFILLATMFVGVCVPEEVSAQGSTFEPTVEIIADQNYIVGDTTRYLHNGHEGIEFTFTAKLSGLLWAYGLKTYNWSINYDESNPECPQDLKVTSNNDSISIKFNYKGNHYVDLTVEDKHGNVATAPTYAVNIYTQEQLKEQTILKLEDFFNRFENRGYNKYISMGDKKIVKARLDDWDVDIKIDPKHIASIPGETATSAYEDCKPLLPIPCQKYFNDILLPDAPYTLKLEGSTNYPRKLWHEVMHAIFDNKEEHVNDPVLRRMPLFVSTDEIYCWYMENIDDTIQVERPDSHLNRIDDEINKPHPDCKKIKQLYKEFVLIMGYAKATRHGQMSSWDQLFNLQLEQLKYLTGFDVDVDKIKQWIDSKVNCLNPTVTNVLPSDQAENVPINTKIRVTFSKTMNTTSVENSILTVPSISGTFNWIADKYLTFIPSQNLDKGKKYSITIGTGAKDENNLELDGNADGEPGPAYTWSFTTGFPLDNPGGDTPDDNHDVSVLDYFQNTNPSDFNPNSKTAILQKGFYDDFSDLLTKYDESSTLVEVDISLEELSYYPVFVIPSGGLYGLDSLRSFRLKLENYVNNGGTLIVLSQQHGNDFKALPGGEVSGFGWREDQSCHFSSVGINTYHPILSGQDSVVLDANVDGFFTGYPVNSSILLSRTKNSMPTMLMYEYGNGSVIATTIYTDWAYGHFASTGDGQRLVRDMIVWAKDTKPIPEYGYNEPNTISVNITSYVYPTIDYIIFRIIDPDKNFVETVNVTESILPFETKIINFTFNKPSKLGIWHMNYSFGNDSLGEEPRVHEGERFAVSKFKEIPNGFTLQNSEISFAVTSEADKFPYGFDAIFTIHIWNNGDLNKNITVEYGPGHPRSYFLTKIVNVPAHGYKSFTYTRSIFHFGWIAVHFFDGSTRIGRADRGYFVFQPILNIDVETDRNFYRENENISVNLSIENDIDFKFDTKITINVLDPGNFNVLTRDLNVNLPAIGIVNESFNFSLPETMMSGEYIIHASSGINENSKQFQFLGANGTLSGRVINWSTNNSIPNSTISIMHGNNKYKMVSVDGNYSFNVPGGYNYEVIVEAPDYVYGYATIDIHPLKNNALNLYMIPVASKVLTMGGGTLTGKVLDSFNNEPISNAIVSIYLDTSELRTNTDSNGIYLFHLPSGEYKMNAAYGSFISYDPNTAIVYSGKTTSVYLYLDNTNADYGYNGTLHGRVSDSLTHEPISATLNFDSGAKIISTNPDGTYSVSLATDYNKHKQRYKVTISATGYTTEIAHVTVFSGRTTTLDFYLKPPNAFNGTLIGGVYDALTHAPLSATLSFNSGAKISTTNPDGTYSVSLETNYDNRNQRYHVDISAMGYTSEVADVTVFSGRTTTLDFYLKPPNAFNGTLTGEVYDALNHTPLNATLNFNSGAKVISTNPNGTYSVSLATNYDNRNQRYRVDISATGYTSETADVTVFSNRTTTLDFYLVPTGKSPLGGKGTLNLTVLDIFNATPISNFNLEIGVFSYPYTDTNGAVSIEFAANAKYWIGISATSYKYISKCVRVPIYYNLTQNYTIYLKPTTLYGTMDLRVLDIFNQTPISNFNVEIGLFSHPYTDTNGQVSIEFAANINYWIGISATGYNYISKCVRVPIYYNLTQTHTIYLKPTTLWGTLDLRVLDLFNQTPISNFNVEIGLFSHPYTDTNGQVSIEFAANTNYWIGISATGYNYISKCVRAPIYYNHTQTHTIYLKPASKYGTIKGNVYDQVTEQPLNATVKIDGNSLSTIDGGYSIKLLPGTKQVTIETEGYDTVQTSVVVYPIWTVTRDFYMSPVHISNGTLIGYVFDIFTIENIANASIIVYSGYPKYIQANMTTDLNGFYSFNLSAGLYAINVRASNYTVYETTATVYPGEVSTVDIPLKPSGEPVLKSPAEFEIVSVPQDLSFDLGENVTFTFKVRNIGDIIGRIELHLNVPGIFEGFNSTWITPNAEKEVNFSFPIPDDLEENYYQAHYEMGDISEEILFYVNGAKISVDGSLDKELYVENETAIFTMIVTNECSFELNLFARVKLNEFEEVRAFNLMNVETLQFYIPVDFNGQKLFYAVYMSSGRALYINGLYIQKKEEIITLYTDQQVYEAGDNVTIFVITNQSGILNITAPGFNTNISVSEPTTIEFTLPSELRSGTYYIEYTYKNISISYPIDVVGYYARILECSLDKEIYDPGETITVNMNVELNQNVYGVLKIWIYDSQYNYIDEFEIDKNFIEGENNLEFHRNLSTDQSGTYALLYGIYTKGSLVYLVSGSEYFDIQAYIPVADAGGPYFVGEGSAVPFNASGSSDPNDDELQFRWDFDFDGEWDTDFSSSPFANYTWYEDYFGRIRVEVSDGNLTDSEVTVVIIDNVAPTVDAGENRIVNMNDLIQFHGSIIDPGTEDTHTIFWDFDDGNTTQSPLSPSHVYTIPGNYTVLLVVEDNDGGIGFDTLNISVEVSTELKPLKLKQEVLTDLENAKTGETSIDKNIDLIIKFVNKSLEEDYWVDDTYLDPKLGNKVFDFEFVAAGKIEITIKMYESEIHNIKKSIANYEKKNKDTTNLESKLASLESALVIFNSSVNKLVRIDERLASIVYYEAQNVSVESSKYQKTIDKKLADAENYRIEAKKEWQSENYETAIKYYNRVWAIAHEVKKFAEK
jgi:rhodanese-related sulfurtransferase/PKD repeat protein